MIDRAQACWFLISVNSIDFQEVLDNLIRSIWVVEAADAGRKMILGHTQYPNSVTTMVALGRLAVHRKQFIKLNWSWEHRIDLRLTYSLSSQPSFFQNILGSWLVHPLRLWELLTANNNWLDSLQCWWETQAWWRQNMCQESDSWALADQLSWDQPIQTEVNPWLLPTNLASLHIETASQKLAVR